MNFDFSTTTSVSQQDDEFDIDLRLEAGNDPGENPSLTGVACATNTSTCSHTTPKLCC